MTPLLAALLWSAQGGEYQRGVQAFEQGRHEEAIALLAEAVRQAPRDAQAWKVLGVVHAARSDYREAEPPFARACELNPRLTDACYYHGRALYMLNRFEDALAPLERALRVDAVRGRAETAIAESLEALGRAAEAEKRFRAAIARRDAAAERARTAYARFLIRAGRTEDALVPLKEALTGNPDSAEAHFQMGRALQQLDRLEDALKHLQRAVQLEPARAPAHLLLARVYRRLGRIPDAERAEKTALSLHGSSTSIR
jgi:tetratricopeptide (TPR) repeat protein